MALHPRNLSILTTRRCPAACDHCSARAGPRETAAIPVERIRGLIDEAANIPSIERIGFSGGECFLLRELDELVGRASERGFVTRVVTNGYWAVNDSAARRRVFTVRAHGLDEMMLSTGTFHQRFVPVERIVFAARAAVEAGIATRISVEACDQSDFDDAPLREALADLTATGRLAIAQSPWIPDVDGLGSVQLSHARFFGGRPPYTKGRCAHVLDVITVTPDQQLMACCGAPSERLPALRIASVAERTLDEALTTWVPELISMWLHVSGPAGIAAFVALHEPGYALPPVASICQACAILQRDERAMGVISRHAAEVAGMVARSFVQLERERGSTARPLAS